MSTYLSYPFAQTLEVAEAAGTVKTHTCDTLEQACKQAGWDGKSALVQRKLGAVSFATPAGDMRVRKARSESAQPAAKPANVQTRTSAQDRAAAARAAQGDALCGSTATKSGKPCGKRAALCNTPAHVASRGKAADAPKSHVAYTVDPVVAALASVLTREQQAQMAKLLAGRGIA